MLLAHGVGDQVGVGKGGRIVDVKSKIGVNGVILLLSLFATISSAAIFTIVILGNTATNLEKPSIGHVLGEAISKWDDNRKTEGQLKTIITSQARALRNGGSLLFNQSNTPQYSLDKVSEQVMVPIGQSEVRGRIFATHLTKRLAYLRTELKDLKETPKSSSLAVTSEKAHARMTKEEQLAILDSRFTFAWPLAALNKDAYDQLVKERENLPDENILLTVKSVKMKGQDKFYTLSVGSADEKGRVKTLFNYKVKDWPFNKSPEVARVIPTAGLTRTLVADKETLEGLSDTEVETVVDFTYGTSTSEFKLLSNKEEISKENFGPVSVYQLTEDKDGIGVMSIDPSDACIIPKAEKDSVDSEKEDEADEDGCIVDLPEDKNGPEGAPDYFNPFGSGDVSLI